MLRACIKLFLWENSAYVVMHPVAISLCLLMYSYFLTDRCGRSGLGSAYASMSGPTLKG